MPFGPLATAGGGGGAPDDAQYVVVGAVPASLPQGRQLTGTASRIVVTDGGAGAAVTLSPGALVVQTDQANTWTVGSQIIQTAVDTTTAFQVFDADGGAPVLSVDTINERVGIGVAAPGAQFQVDISGAVVIGQIIKLDAGQSEDAFQVRKSDGTVFFAINSDGDLFTDKWLAQDSNTFIGVGVAGAGNLAHGAGSEGYYNSFVGYWSGRAITSGYGNSALGYRALRAVTTGYGNIAFGYDCLVSNTAGYYNMAFGYQALENNIDGVQNVGIGQSALKANIDGNYNLAIGTGTLISNTTADENVAIGHQAAFYTQTGSKNVVIGASAGFGSAGNSFSNNVLIGNRAGRTLTTGSSVIFLGYYAGYRQTAASNILLIDNQQRADIATELTHSILYGTMGANPEDQQLTINAQANVARLDVATNTITLALNLAHTTSGVAAPLFGISATHELEDAGGVLQTASEDATLWAVATAGSEQPLRRWTNYPNGAAGPGYGGYITADDVDNVALTIIPNGAGDVTVGLEVVYFVSESAGGSAGGNVTVLNGAAANLYADGVDTLTLAVAADGSATLQRTAGAATFDVSLWLVWV